MAKTLCTYTCVGKHGQYEDDYAYNKGEYDFTCCLECKDRFDCEEACHEESSKTCGLRRGSTTSKIARDLMGKKK